MVIFVMILIQWIWEYTSFFDNFFNIQLGIIFASQFGELVGQFLTKSHGFW